MALLEELEELYADDRPSLWQRLTVPLRDWFTFRRYGKPAA